MEGEKPAKVLDRAVALAGCKKNDAARLTKDALLRNLDIAEKLGCLDDAGLAATRRGKAAMVMKGPYKGTSFPWITSSRGRWCRNWTT